jgi:alcohol dehydrogenase
MNSHCLNGGWRLGHLLDGTQAEYVRIVNADSSLHHVPQGVDEKALVMLSDILPTGLECGVLNGKVQPGCSVVIVGGGPVGLAALMTAQLYSPSLLIMVDKDQNRLQVAKKLGAHHVIEPGSENAEEAVKKLTDGLGCDTVIEAVGVPATFELCQDLVAPGGTISNIGVHGKKCDLHLEKLWAHNICELGQVFGRLHFSYVSPAITTRLVDTVTTPMLLRLFAGGKIQAGDLITHRMCLTANFTSRCLCFFSMMMLIKCQTFRSRIWKRRISPSLRRPSILP